VNISDDLRFEVLAAVKMSLVVLWVVERVILYVVTNVSEEHITSIFTRNVEAIHSSETLITT
jgi:hypothetical protein